MTDARFFREEPQPDPMADTPLTDRKQVKTAKTRAKNRERERDNTLAGIMSVPEGRRFFHWLIGQCGPLQFPVNYPAPPCPIDVNGTMVNIGKMAIGNLLIAQLTRVCPEKYLDMLKESQETIDG